MFDIAFNIKNKKIEKNDKILSQSLSNANKIFDRQQLKQIFVEESTNKFDFQVENNASTLLSCNNNEIDYAKLVVKKQTKTKSLETKRKYLILQKRNKRLQKLIRNNKIVSQE